MKNQVKLLTFVDVITGLSSPTLHSQYFDEYVKLSKFVNSISILTSEITNLSDLPKAIRVIKPPISTIPKIRGFTKMLYYLIYALKLRNKINLIYVRTVSPPDIFTSWIVSSLLKIPLIMLIGGTCVYEPLTFKNRIFRWFLSKALGTSKKIILYSARMIPFIKPLGKNLTDNKFVIIRNGVDQNRFKPLEKDKKLLEKLNINSDEKVICYVGRLNEKKGVIDVLNAVNLLTKNKNFKLLLIGSLEKNSVDFKKIHETIESLNLKDKVIFLKVPNNELPKYHSCTDVFIYMTKRCEALPRAILEAMACGKPIIATPVAGIPDAIIDDKTGYIVEDYEKASNRLDQILSDRNLSEKLGKNCREMILSEFTYDVILPQMKKLFQTTVNISESKINDFKSRKNL